MSAKMSTNTTESTSKTFPSNSTTRDESSLETSTLEDSETYYASTRASIEEMLVSAASPHDQKLQQKIADIRNNSAAIAKQERRLLENAAVLAQETDEWQKENERNVRGLMKFGDLQNWAELLERDFMVLEETLRLVEGGEEVERASGGSQWMGGAGRR